MAYACASRCAASGFIVVRRGPLRCLCFRASLPDLYAHDRQTPSTVIQVCTQAAHNFSQDQTMSVCIAASRTCGVTLALCNMLGAKRSTEICRRVSVYRAAGHAKYEFCAHQQLQRRRACQERSNHLGPGLKGLRRRLPP